MGIFDFFKKEPSLFKNVTKNSAKLENNNLFVQTVKKKFNNYNLEVIVAFANYVNPKSNWHKDGIVIEELLPCEYSLIAGVVFEHENGDKIEFYSDEENYCETIFINNKKICFCIEYYEYSKDDFSSPPKKKLKLIANILSDKEGDFKVFLEKQKKELDNIKTDIFKEFDVDNNGIVDIIQEDVLTKLLKEHQKKIIEIDRTYIQQFVKTSSYIDDKKKNIQMIFEILKKSENVNKLEEYINILKNEIHTFNLLLINALGMITALVEDDMITFYQIHDSFDKLGVFNSNWENEVSQKLSNIGDKLDGLMFSIQDMSYKIVKEIGNLSYVTQELNNSMSKQLNQINSSINLNTLMTGIQTYQMYKINKNTKQLRG